MYVIRVRNMGDGEHRWTIRRRIYPNRSLATRAVDRELSRGVPAHVDQYDGLSGVRI